MSDLYLELRSRIAVVAEQTHLGEQRIRDAQAAVGLSNEAIARAVHVSEKTWRRWKSSGQIPTSSLPAVAKALRLELRELDPDAADARIERLELELAEVQQALAAVEEVRASVARIEELLRAREAAVQ